MLQCGNCANGEVHAALLHTSLPWEASLAPDTALHYYSGWGTLVTHKGTNKFKIEILLSHWLVF